MKHNIPVTATVMGIGCMNKHDPYYISAIGCLVKDHQIILLLIRIWH